MDRPEIAIRAMEPADMADLTVLLNRPNAVWGTLQRPYTSVAERSRRIEGYRPERHLAAVIEGRVVGSASLDRFRDRRAHAGSIGMAVHDDYQGLGCGRALMTALIDYADRWTTLLRLELTVYPDNARAVALYQSLGFETEGRLRAYAVRDGGFTDALAMARLRAAPLYQGSLT